MSQWCLLPLTTHPGSQALIAFTNKKSHSNNQVSFGSWMNRNTPPHFWSLEACGIAHKLLMVVHTVGGYGSTPAPEMAESMHFPFSDSDHLSSTPANSVLSFLFNQNILWLQLLCLPSLPGMDLWEGPGESLAIRFAVIRHSAGPSSPARAVFSSVSSVGGPGLGVWAQPGKLITASDCQGPSRAGRGKTLSLNA